MAVLNQSIQQKKAHHSFVKIYHYDRPYRTRDSILSADDIANLTTVCSLEICMLVRRKIIRRRNVRSPLISLTGLRIEYI